MSFKRRRRYRLRRLDKDMGLLNRFQDSPETRAFTRGGE